MSCDSEASTRAQVLSQVGRQAENRPKVLPGGDIQAARVGGETSRVRGMAAGGDAAVGRALSADLLKLPRWIGNRPVPASLVDGNLLDAAL